MRLATYNVEWFTALFDTHDRLLVDDRPSARHGTTRAEQARALGHVFLALDADAVLIVEAPDANRRRRTIAALENFATHFGLRTRSAIMGFRNDTQQEIALLYDPGALEARHAPRAGEVGVPRFDGVFEVDLGIDGTRDQVRFSKPPLELDITTRRGTAFHLIGVHLKSKAPHAAKSRADIPRVRSENRRKQLAQAVWLRARIDQHLSEGTPMVVLGDLNDGPGLDSCEGLFERSSVEVVMGGTGGAQLFDPHAHQALATRLAAAPTTARFWVRSERRYLQALLDYAMISPDLRQHAPAWRIWHPTDDPACWQDSDLRAALMTASDHFPVTLDLDI